MYPYEPSSSDLILSKYDDNFEDPFKLGILFVFHLSTIYINTNGFVSFLSPINNKKNLLPKKNPISITMISPFWFDINTLNWRSNILQRKFKFI
jgi:hypothetical protein